MPKNSKIRKFIREVRGIDQKPQHPHEKIMKKIFEDEEMTPTEKKSWTLYKHIISLRENENHKKEDIVKLVRLFHKENFEKDITLQRAYQLVDEAYRFYGKIAMRDKDAYRAYYAQLLDKIVEKALNVKNEEGVEIKYDIAISAMREAAKIRELYNENKEETILELPLIVISSNPEPTPESETIDISHETTEKVPQQ